MIHLGRFSRKMKTRQIAACHLDFLSSLLVSGCSDSESPDSALPEVQRSVPETDDELGQVARKVLDSEIEWKDSITNDGRLTKLFQPPAPDPDETRHYRVKEGEHLFAIALARFGSRWLGTVVNFSTEDPMRQFERSSAEDCLAAIQSEFRFTEEIEQVVGCAFP